MISILIPVFNYNSYPLVNELYKYCTESNIHFEILCQDDASNEFLQENQRINNVKHCNFSKNNLNLGRGPNINLLAEKAKFDWLLIMDCDTFPIQNNFIRNYIFQINNDEKVVFGGIEYQKEKPADHQLLRWYYGNARESLSVEKRKTNPNGNALTSNILIQKKVFLSTKFDASITKYGYEDLVFLSDLKKKRIVVKHIENPTYHLGLETSKQFLDKTKTALENLKKITLSNSSASSESKLLKVSILLKRLHLVTFIAFLFKKNERKMEQNLLSATPSLLLFNLYKLGYYCEINSK